MSAEPFLYHIESVATPGECWEVVRGREPSEYEGDPSFVITPLYALSPPAVSDGWVMVPVEPTEAMVNAGYRRWLNKGRHSGYTVVEAIYRTMTAARLPAAPTGGRS